MLLDRDFNLFSRSHRLRVTAPARPIVIVRRTSSPLMLSFDRYVLSTKAIKWLDLLAEHNDREQKGWEEDLHWIATLNR